MNFKVGDRVIIKYKPKDSWTTSWVLEMDKCVGKKGVIVGIDRDDYEVQLDEETRENGCFWYYKPCVELVDPQMVFDFMEE